MDGSWEVPICFYYQQGNCRFGEGCHYRHVQAPDVSLDSICWYYQENGWCPHGRSCKFMHNPVVTFHPVPPPHRRSTDQSVCIFFQRGSCKRGNNCSFLHPGAAMETPNYPGSNQPKNADIRAVKQKPSLKELQGTIDGSNESKRKEDSTTDNSENKAKKSNRRRKPKSKQMSKIEEKKNHESVNAEASATNDLSVQSEVQKSEKHPSMENSVKKEDSDVLDNKVKTCSLTHEQCLSLQSRERKIVKTRIVGENLVTKTNTKGEEYYEFEFSSSDPDWRYDFKAVPLRISFPDDYPKSSMKVKCLSSDVLPDSIVSICNKSISKWLEQRMENIGRSSETGDLTFRPFLRWLDRKLEGIFTEGLKEYKRAMVLRASGISIWTPDKLKRALGHDSEEEAEENEPPQSSSQTDASAAAESEVPVTGQPDHEATKGPEQQPAASGIDVRPSGVELRLRDLQLGEQTASVTFTRVRLVLQCERCRHPQELAMTASQPLSLHCERCNNEMMACFRAALLHAFSPVIGYFDGMGCRPRDAAFVDWKFSIVCLSCDQAIDRTNIRPGTLETFKCVSCFKEQRFAFNSVHFTRLSDDTTTNFESGNVRRIVSEKPKKVPKDPAIREGFPLPQEGTCKHYKKSHRWLRFPCCGRAFPCDVCHDEAITDGHEMAFANRMICGFCCKEQAFSAERPCVSCHKSMTRMRSSFWEGGKGCRDKTAMSRNDAKKYANKNKTVSKRSQKT